MRRERSESGQATVEAVIALFVLVFLLFGIVSLAVVAYSVVDANARIQKVSWSIDADALAAAPDKNAYVRGALVNGVPGLPSDNLGVSHAEVQFSTVEAKQSLGAADVHYGISEITQSKRVAKISFDVTFSVPSLFPGLPPGPKQERHIEHEAVVDQKAEVK